MENNGAFDQLNCKKSNAVQHPRRMPLRTIDNIKHPQVSQECRSHTKANKRNKNIKVSSKQNGKPIHYSL